MTKLVSKYQNPSKPIRRTRILFTPEQMALFESQATRVPGMNNSGGNRYREEGVLALQYLEQEAKRKEEEIKSRMEMRPTLKRKVTTAERLQGKEDEYELTPLVVGMSGKDPLLGTLFDLYVGGKALEGIGKLGLWGAAKYAPGTLLGNWSRGYFINNEMKLVNPFEESVRLGITLRATAPTGQRRIVSEDTYPMYRGKQHSVNEVVNPDGTVNPRQAMKILHEVSELFPGSYRMERRLENPESHQTDPTTYDHTKNVTSSAWDMKTPEGFTKQDLMIAALGHDFGKIVAGDGHAQIGADLARQVFPDLTDAQYTAIAEHMGTPKTLLGRATKAADIDNGRSVGLNLTPLYLAEVSNIPEFTTLGLSWMEKQGTTGLHKLMAKLPEAKLVLIAPLAGRSRAAATLKMEDIVKAQLHRDEVYRRWASLYKLLYDPTPTTFRTKPASIVRLESDVSKSNAKTLAGGKANAGGSYEKKSHKIRVTTSKTVSAKNLEDIGFHEGIHSYGLGESPSYLWKAKYLNFPEGTNPYLLDPREIATHGLQWGLRLGIKVGLPYPGKEAMIKMIENRPEGLGFGGIPYTLYNNAKTNSDYRRLWSLLNGTFKDGGKL